MGITTRSGPAEERDFDPVVPCKRRFRDIEEFPGATLAPDEILALKERAADPATTPMEAEVLEEIISSCSG